MRITELLKAWVKQGVGSMVGVVLGASLVTIVNAHNGLVMTDVIHSCINNRRGTIKIIDASGTCASNEMALDWNAQGIQGPKGDKGDQGTPGVSGHEVVTAIDSSTGAYKFALAQCASGKQVLGGGALMSARNGGDIIDAFAVTQSAPDGAAGWRASAAPNWNTTTAYELHVYAICTNVAP